MISLNGKKICENCFYETTQEPCPRCGFDRSSYKRDANVLPIGSVLTKRYKVGGVLGKGGFGITYMAYDMKLECRVAVKEYYPYGVAARDMDAITVSTANDDTAASFKTGAEKFYDEARLVAKFNGNPNIVGVHDFFYENETVYFIMDMLKGKTLKQYIKEKGKLSYEQAVYVMQEVAGALMVTHSANVLHRDISPDNIMICDDGTVKLLDFGAARQVVSEGSQSLSVILKQGFAPLEQYQKKGKQGPWTDIYSLGATIYHSITGDVLEDPMTRFDGDEEYESNKYNIPDELWQIIHKATMLRMQDRYQDVFAMHCDIEKLSIQPEPLVKKNRHIKKTVEEPKATEEPKAVEEPTASSPEVMVTMPLKEEVTEIPATVPLKEEVTEIPATMPLKEEVTEIPATVPLKEEVTEIPATVPLKEEIKSDRSVKNEVPHTGHRASGWREEEKRLEEEKRRKELEEQQRKKSKKKITIKSLFIVAGVIVFVAFSIINMLKEYDYEINGDEATYVRCRRESSTITIPETIKGVKVTAIGDYAFYNCEALEEIVIPDSVEYIGDKAFRDCKSLEEIVIPDSVEYIGDYAFYNCEALEEIVIPDSVEYIGNHAFEYCNNLKRVVLPDGLTEIRNGMFEWCDKLESIEIPDSVTYIDSWAFSYCDAIEELVIPKSVEKVGLYAFDSCDNLKKVTFMNPNVKIDEDAFYGCDNVVIIK